MEENNLSGEWNSKQNTGVNKLHKNFFSGKDFVLFLFGSISGILFLGGALFQRCVFNPPQKMGGAKMSPTLTWALVKWVAKKHPRRWGYAYTASELSVWLNFSIWDV